MASLRAQWDIRPDWNADATLYYRDELEAFDIDSGVRLDVRVGWGVADAMTFELIGQGLFDEARREWGAGEDAVLIEQNVMARLAWRR
jgi:hypothetical protein